jgi:hypothetical protein
VKQRNETEEKLRATIEEVEKLTETTDELCAKLQEERKKKLALEKRTAHSDRIIKDLMLQRDKAVREVEALHAKKGGSSATAEGKMHITELSCSEIKEATNNFDHSLKVGESVYGSVYKGFLRHTNVAIKKLNPGGTESQSQFNQEVELLVLLNHLVFCWFKYITVLQKVKFVHDACFAGRDSQQGAASKPCYSYRSLQGGSNSCL